MGSALKAPRNSDLSPVQAIADTPFVRQCSAWFSKERQWINELHLQLCRVPAPTFLEGKRAEWMIEKLKSFGWHARLDRAGNVVAHLTPSPAEKCIALTAHLDTVLAPRSPEDVTSTPDGKMKGPGVSDNGAGLAALLAIARAVKLHANGTDDYNSLILVANVGEEGEGNLSGMRYLCRQSSLAEKIEAYMVLDGPSTDHVTSKALASRRFEVSYSGSGGHSWTDFGAGNPIHALSRAITFFTDTFLSTSPMETPRVSFNFGVIDGGSTINSIPTSARVKVDIRSENPARIEEMTALLTTSVERALQVENTRATSRVTARVKEIGSRPGGMMPDDAPILQVIRQVDQFLGIKSHLDCASTDANIPLSMNAQAVSIGAGGSGGGAHTPGEWFHPDHRDVGLKRILLALELLLRQVNAMSEANDPVVRS